MFEQLSPFAFAFMVIIRCFVLNFECSCNIALVCIFSFVVVENIGVLN